MGSVEGHAEGIEEGCMEKLGNLLGCDAGRCKIEDCSERVDHLACPRKKGSLTVEY